MNKICYSHFSSPFGPVFVAKTTKGICTINFSNITETGFLSSLSKRFQVDIVRNDKALLDVKKNLLDYFNGHQVNFKLPLDLSNGTQFQRKVWNKVKEIPYGELRSYKWVAKSINNVSASRAVGNAVGQNPVAPIIPCHRVVCSDGSLGGYSSGIPIKKRLLKLERIT